MLVLIALAVGGLIPIQTSPNSRVRLSVGNHPVVSALISFSMALLVAIVATTISQGNALPQFAPGASLPWWLWLGGVVSSIFVIAGATLSTLIGTATTVITFNAGTIAAGQVLEARGAFGARKNPLTLTRLIGLAVIFLGVLAVRLL